MTGDDTRDLLSVRVDRVDLVRIDKIAKDLRMTRSEFVRWLLPRAADAVQAPSVASIVPPQGEQPKPARKPKRMTADDKPDVVVAPEPAAVKDDPWLAPSPAAPRSMPATHCDVCKLRWSQCICAKARAKAAFAKDPLAGEPKDFGDEVPF